jgi:amidohydrolase
MKFWMGALALCGLAVTNAFAKDLDALVRADLPSLVERYKLLHAHPELSHHEIQTSAVLAAELRSAGYAVAEHVGRYPDGTQAYGVVAILQNGAGPRLLIRTDLDALPVTEETALSYASRVTSRTSSGVDVGVMHACGHDIHITTLIGVGRALVALKDQWHGTVMLIGQPSEETIDGAKALLADNLYERFGKPDMAIALHDTELRAAGTVSVGAGAMAASSTSVDVTMRGVTAHGARPQAAKDPVVMAAEFIVQVQTIVSRQMDPFIPSVLTVGDVHGGTRRNIIPGEVKMELTVRTFNDEARTSIIEGIGRTARGVAFTAGVPDELAPIVKVLDNEYAPVLFNDPSLTARVRSALVGKLGAQNVFDEAPEMGSEDFGVFGLKDHSIPTVMFQLGAIDPAKFASAAAHGEVIPGLHSSRFQPDPDPTLRTGVISMTSVAIALMQTTAIP